MSDLRELYQTVILDHNKQPRNFRVPEGANRVAAGHNPLCGDRVTVHLRVEDEVVKDVGFQGNGCAISTASASLMTQAVKGRPLDEVRKLFDAFLGLVTSDPQREVDDSAVGKLAVLAGVREYPVRVKCATLAWHTLRAALAGGGVTVKTE
jgi:nitrogen fixation protein NifU and related proteins